MLSMRGEKGFPGGGLALSCALAFSALLHSVPMSGAGDGEETKTPDKGADAGMKGEAACRTHFGAEISDRASWKKIAKLPSAAAIIKAAEADAKTPLPATSDELYLEFSRNGNRRNWETLNFKRRERLRTFMLAECVEDKGRFLKPLEEALRSICAEKTWLMPAHDRDLRNFKGKAADIDLGSAMLGFSMGELHCAMKERLAPEVGEMVRDNIKRRIASPFRAMLEGRQERNWWLGCDNNWNAVCLCGSTGAALCVAESPEERDFFVKEACERIKHFLSGFSKDGYCSEGYGYWVYGFEHFAILSELVRKATGGKTDLLLLPEARNPALYGFKIEIVNGVCPSFSDGKVDPKAYAELLAHIDARLGLGLTDCRNYDFARFGRHGKLYADLMYCFTEFPRSSGAPVWEPELRSWFPDAGILVCRPDKTMKGDFAVALKGGHNEEHHNHNDVGSYQVLAKDFSILCDPGAEVYTARTFSKDRYQSAVLNSYGHPVPMVDGKLQRTGREARGVPLFTNFSEKCDRVAFDISSAYDVKGLKKLVRTFEYSREGKGSLAVTDEFEFDSPKSFETALLTFGKAEFPDRQTVTVSDRGRKVRAEIDAGGLELRLSVEEMKEDLAERKGPLSRIAVRLAEPSAKGSVKVRISPVD